MIRKLFFICLCAVPVAASAEVINAFNVDITINQDGSILVEEEIIYDFESANRHGIYRTIPTRFEVDSEPRKLEIDIQSVERNGQSEPYTITSSQRPWKLRIGDADVEITGKHTYTYTYEVRGAMRYFDTYNELYWNLTGDEWEVPIRSWQAQVRTPNERVYFTQSSCYQGSRGATSTCASSITASSSAVFGGTNIAPGSGATIAVAIPAGSIAQQILHPKSVYWIYAGLAVLFAVLAYAVIVYRRIHSKYDTHQPIVTQYETYESIGAALSAYLLSRSVGARIITAGLLELVQLGYISVTQQTKRGWFRDKTYYILRYLKQDTAELTDLQVHIINIFFDSAQNMQNQECNTNMYKVKSKAVGKLSGAMRQEVHSRNWREQASYPWKQLGVIVTGLLAGWALVIPQPLLAPFITIGTLIPFIILLYFAANRRTQDGYRAYYHTKGLRRYIEVAEEDRIAFHNAPEKNPETFTKYLPLAVAFGLEKQWIKQFEDMYITQEGIYTQDGSPMNMTNIAAITALNSSVSAAAIPAGSSPSTGGGYSGGGAGGGGGGSW